MNSFFRRAAMILVASAAASPAAAATTTPPSNMNVTANVTANCLVSADAMAFGDYDATSDSNNDVSTNVSVTCTNGLPWTASANAGNGAGASFNARRLEAETGDSQLSYNLYKDAGRTQVWGTGVDGNGAVIEGIGEGSEKLIPIYGRIAGGQTGAKVGNYSDTVQVTVSY